MQGEFEKKIHEQMQQFNLEPSPQVWNDVASALQERKRRRFVIWWWLIPVLLAGSAALWYFGFNSTDKNDIVKTQEVINKNNAATDENKKVPDSSYVTNNETIIPGKDKNISQPGEAIKQTEILNNKKETANNILIKKQIVADEKTNQSIPVMHEEQAPKKDEVVIANTNEPKQLNNEIKAQNNNAEKTQNTEALPVNTSNDSTANHEVAKMTEEKKMIQDSSIKATALKKKDSKEKRKGDWYIHFEGGITSTNEAKIFGSNTSLPSFYYGNNPGLLTGNYNYGTQDSTFHIIKSQNGYHINAGADYQYQLSKRWTVDAGLHFMFISNKQKAGKFVDSVLDVSKAYDNSSGTLSSPSFRMVAVPGYYQAGYSHDISNTATAIGLPVNINFIINPNAKTKFLISTGASYEYLLTSKWLLPDSKNNKLYYSKELLQKNIFSWQAGAGVTTRQNLQFGLQYKQSISPIADKNLQPKLYWQHFSLYTNIPLQHKNHSLTK